MYNVSKVNGKFQVIENFTGQVVKVFDNHADAHVFYRQMKGGKGFQGNTPPFFLKEFKVVRES